MRKSKFTQEQIVAALKLAGSGGKVEEICRKLSLTKGTFYRWKQKYGGMAAVSRVQLPEPTGPNEAWAMDFVHDGRLAAGPFAR